MEGSEDRATTSASEDRKPALDRAPTPPAQQPSAPPRTSGEHEDEGDEDDQHDGCDHEHDGDGSRDAPFTTDEELPPAHGGVA